MKTRNIWLATALAAVLVGARPGHAIVGPSRDGAALAPYVVMVLNLRGTLAGFCSGLVVSPTVVLTAAHCVPAGAAVKVHYRADDGAPVLLDTAEIIRNPGYRDNAIRTRERSIDLALIRLPAPLPARFRAAVLATDLANRPGTPVRLAGFGLTREGEAKQSGTLRIADVVAREPASGVLLWAKDPHAAGSGACTGDSGGPVFADGADSALAIMVWSAGSGRANCGALTQAVWIAPQRSWIDGVLAGWGVK